MPSSYDLANLNPSVFENLVNFLVINELGLGGTGFGPGPDGGRDGYFSGEAPYPSTEDRWKGIWYIQSKFHAPHLSADPQKWLQRQIKEEIDKFLTPDTDRTLPDNWIIATNVEQSPTPETGSFDKIKTQIKERLSHHPINVDVWDGEKIVMLLSKYPHVARYFGHFITPGHVVTALYDQLTDARASLEEIVRYFVATQFVDQTFTKLDQAGSSSDVRPKVHDLFVDLPFSVDGEETEEGILSHLCAAASQCLKHTVRNALPDSWRGWSRHPKRTRVMLIKGGPGQGKSTIGQYLCQINRAWLILADDGPPVIEAVRGTAQQVREAALRAGIWPTSARFPIQLELKEYAHWYSGRLAEQPKTVLNYIASTLSARIGTEVLAKTIKGALRNNAWIVVFDGLDEVPNDFKDQIAKESLHFLDDLVIEIDADILAVCTSRPQGYSGQFSGIDGPVVDLTQLEPEKAMECARPLLRFGRSTEESDRSIAILDAAIKTPSVMELMTTPLQAHIMAVVVRDGGRPPDKRWQLFNNFYNVIKKRETQKHFPDPKIERLLREEDRLLKAVHMYLGFVLHARAETSDGAQTMLSKSEFRDLVRDVVGRLVGHDIDETVHCVMEATTERLVLVSTPETNDYVRFDIRQLQEFFAAEFTYAGVDVEELSSRMITIGGDAHWREVVHFLLSALIENQRSAELAIAVDVLRRLDEGDEGSSTRIFNQRMFRGGWLACRLLLEGVLEQDTRDRQQVQPLLEPIGGLIDLESLSALKRVHSIRTRQWLVEYLLSRLNKSAATDCPGLLLVLGWLLPDISVDVPAVVDGFLRLPHKLQEAVIDVWAADLPHAGSVTSRARSESVVSYWVIELALRLLSSSRWLLVSPNCLIALMGLCRAHKRYFETACSKASIDDATISSIFDCLDLSGDSRSNEERSGQSLDFGLIKAVGFEETWLNAKIPKILDEIDTRAARRKVGGLFDFFFLVISVAKHRSPEEIAEVCRLMEAVGPERLGVLPDRLLALLPLAGPHSASPYNFGALTNWNWSESPAIEYEGPFRHLALEPSKVVTLEQCEKLRSLPRIAIDIAFNHALYSIPGCDAFFVELTGPLDDNPEMAAEHILQWGLLAEHCPERLERVIASVEASELRQVRVRPFKDVKPFSLDLSRHVHLLPLLARSLLELTSRRKYRFRRELIEEDEAEYLGNLYSQYGLHLEELRAVAVSSSVSRASRAGALALGWLIASAPDFAVQTNVVDLVKEMQLYSEVVDKSSESWLTQMAVRVLLAPRSDRDVGALGFVTMLLSRCRDGEGPREQIGELLQIWRERSSAPITKKQSLQKWIGYRFQAPRYVKG